MMASYKIRWKSSAARELRKLPTDIISRIVACVEALASDPFPPGARKMISVADAFRLRVGSYRVIYRVYDQELVVEIVRVGHRSNIYGG